MDHLLYVARKNFHISSPKSKSTTDAEFALGLQLDNQEIKKQFAEAKALYEKVMIDPAYKVF